MKTDIDYFEFKSFEEMYEWFLNNSKTEKEVYVKVSKQKPEKCMGILSYYDAVKVALCFGWIDSTLRNINGNLIQRFSPRKKNSHWTKTNIRHCIELNKAKLLTRDGKIACPHYKNKNEPEKKIVKKII